MVRLPYKNGRAGICKAVTEWESEERSQKWKPRQKEVDLLCTRENKKNGIRLENTEDRHQ